MPGEFSHGCPLKCKQLEHSNAVPGLQKGTTVRDRLRSRAVDLAMDGNKKNRHTSPMLKTAANPDSLPMEKFDAIR
jgi:hypothetical protein